MNSGAIALCLNMTKNNSDTVRAKMADAGIVPAHLQVKWLQLTILPKDYSPRWVMAAVNSYHNGLVTTIVNPDQFINVFSLMLLNPDLDAKQYLETIKLNKQQVGNLYRYPDWAAWLEQQYPKYFLPF